MNTTRMAALMGAAAVLAIATPAFAQQPAANPASSTDTAPTDPNGFASAPPTAEEATAQAGFLAAQVDALQQQIDALKAQMAQVQPSWKGAPQWTGDNGFTFKPKGYAMFDAGYVDNPGNHIVSPNLGWNTRIRRAVIGAQGTLPGGFGYNAEFNLAQGTVGYEDIILTYAMKSAPVTFTVGNFYPLSSLDTMTSSRVTSFMERAAFTEAFNYDRRLGVAVALADKADTYTLTAGIFSQRVDDTNVARTGWQASVRGTYSPNLLGGKLHLGASYQHRRTQDDSQATQYRSRVYTQTTDFRFVDTGLIAAKGDDVVGLELGGVFGPLHFAAEAQKLWVDAYKPGDTLTGNSGFGAVVPNFYDKDPSFRSAYAEVGYFLTGETRGYKGGKWDRVKVLHPFDQGGMGAIQINGRVDFLDLKDSTGGGSLASPDYVNGGSQLSYNVSAIWNPIDYLRFIAQFSHTNVDGGPRSAVVKPTSTDPVNDRSYSVDSFALRAQVDF